MFVTHLSLTHFRNYRKLELEFTRRLTLLQGRNGQGKTNLLEAIYFLATSKAVHAQTEREVVDWGAQEEPIPYARIGATIQDLNRRTYNLEILLTPRGDGVNYTKQIKINGASKRSLDLIGLLRAVLFLPEDIKLVDGSPGERRRYLDIALCQIDPDYCRALSSYQKVLAQRNGLLKNLREKRVRPSAPEADAQIGFWDEKLVQHGSRVLARRHNFVLQLEAKGKERHRDLTDGQESYELHFVPSFNYGLWSAADFARWRSGENGTALPPSPQTPVTADEVAEMFVAKLAERRPRELAAGATLYGPHRDDLRFVANGHDLRTYGSRGQQRTAALSLKLAEVQTMTEVTGTAPLLLLDDVMSELDAQRRSTLLAALDGVEQAIVTTTDWEDFTPSFRSAAECFYVSGGTVTVAGEDTETAQVTTPSASPSAQDVI